MTDREGVAGDVFKDDGAVAGSWPRGSESDIDDAALTGGILCIRCAGSGAGIGKVQLGRSLCEHLSAPIMPGVANVKIIGIAGLVLPTLTDPKLAGDGAVICTELATTKVR